MHAGKEVRIIADAAERVRILDKHPGQIRADGGGVKGGAISHDDVDALEGGAGADDADGLGMAGVRHKEGVCFGARVPAHGDGFCGGGAFIQQGGVRHRQPCQGRDHGLEVHEHFQTSLGDFRLVRGVGRVPAGVLQYIAEDDGRSDGAVVALANEGFQKLVFPQDGTEFLQGFRFRFGGGQVQRGFHADICGNDVRNEFVKRLVAEAVEHFPALFSLGADVPAGKI